MQYMLESHTKITKLVSDQTSAYMDLGGLYNGWSLTETQTTLAKSIEKLGEGYDSTSALNLKAVRVMEHEISEAIQEYALYAKAVTKLLKRRLVKQSAYEGALAKSEKKAEELIKLEASEQEAMKISTVLNHEGLGNASVKTSGNGIFAKLNSIIDRDPELTRRQRMSKLKTQIEELKSSSRNLQLEGQLMQHEIQSDLNRFQTLKEKDMNALVLEYAKFMRSYHARMRESWRESLESL